MHDSHEILRGQSRVCKPRRMYFFPQIEGLINGTGKNLNSLLIKSNNTTLVKGLLTNPTSGSRPTSMQSAHNCGNSKKTLNMLATLPPPVLESNTTSPRLVNFHNVANLVQFPVPARLTKNDKETAVASSISRLSLKRMCLFNKGSLKKERRSVGAKEFINPLLFRILRKNKATRPQLPKPVQPSGHNRLLSSCVPSRVLFSARKLSKPAVSSPLICEPGLILCNGENYSRPRLKTADPERISPRDRQDTRYNKRSLFASLDTGREIGKEPAKFRVLDMNFGQSLQQHLILPSCWT